ncbi:MAG: autotransporter assembly complex family protein [Gammaproteobacteria bacterium]|jgi:translocation and assembly module TamA|nr:autotransporter assembly complex family protein [Gammaproteobacteria bacterium]
MRGWLCVLTALAFSRAQATSVVVIEGLSGEPLTNAEAYLGFGAESCASPTWRLEALFARGERRLRESLQPFGYYAPSIAARQEVVDDCLQAQFTVEPGELTRYSAVQVEIRGPESAASHWQSLLQASPLKVGGVVDHRVYERYKQRFTALARRYGYFSSRFDSAEIRVQPADGTATVNLIFVPGPRFTFGEIVLDQDVVDDELVRRFVEVERGEPFDSQDVAELYDAMLATGYFASAELRTVPAQDGSPVVDIEVSATRAKASTWTAGVGFGTDTGPQLRLGYNNRRRNRAGHQWGASGSASRIIKQAGLEYRIPLDQPRAEWLSFEAGYKDEQAETLASQQAKLGLKRLQRRGESWIETQFVDVTNEDFAVAGEPGNIFYIAPGISWSTVRGSGASRPASAYRLAFQVSGTTEFIGSDLNFLQSTAGFKSIVTLPAGIRLLTRLDAGVTWVDDFQDLPASLRFFAGGDFSVRGYDYKTLGPVDANGVVEGGDNVITGSVEIDRLISANWALAAFVDGGNAFDDFNDLELQWGVGGGVRWFSPVGPLRIDIAFPLSDQQREDFRLHITLSPDI